MGSFGTDTTALVPMGMAVVLDGTLLLVTLGQPIPFSPQQSVCVMA